MQLTNGEKKILLKKEDWDKLKKYDDKVEYAKSNTLIHIIPTRIENIMLHFSCDRDTDISPLVGIFFNETGYYSSLIYLNAIEINSPTGIAKTIITQIGNRKSHENLIVTSMCFFCNQLENDVNLNVDVYKKWSYQIHAGRLNEEFCYSDGLLHHDMGDAIDYNNNSTQLFVMKIDKEAYIVHCSAIGFF